jgi:membrane-associated protease RseP (regulator of RpoE activity)
MVLKVSFTARIRMRSMPLLQISKRRFPGHACDGIGLLATPAIMSIMSIMAATVCGGAFAGATDAAPAADTTLPEPALAPTAPAFKAEDISIGEPITLPFATPLAPPAPDRPAPDRPTPNRPATSGLGIAPPAAAGTGWLGFAVDDTVVTGRLVVVEVSPDGPAAKAGVRPQDMLLAINGNHLQTGDELAAALAAIVPGQRVKMAVGRDNRVEDVVAQASSRPPAAVARDWQSATASQMTPPNVALSASPAAPKGLVAPSRLVPEATSFGVLPAPTPSPNQSATPTANLTPTATANPTIGGRTALGVRTVPVDPTVQTRFRLSDAQGAFVIGVVQDLPASKAGVPPGSVIVAINNQPVRSPQDLTHLVARGPVGTPVPLHYVLPGGQSKQADVVLQSLEQPLERALIGSEETGQATGPTAAPPSLQPAPMTTRRVQPTAGYQSDEQSNEPTAPARLEELLRRMSNRLEQIERRLERIESGR